MGSNGHRAASGRWDGIERPYTTGDVEGLRGSVQVEHTLARLGAERLWSLFPGNAPFVAARRTKTPLVVLEPRSAPPG